MSNSLNYRQATQDDLPVVLEWTLALMHHEQIDPELELPLKANIKEQLNDWLTNLVTNDNALFIIAEDPQGNARGGILGIIQLAANDFVDVAVYGLIQMVWVNSEYRKQGIASALVRYMEETFKTMDIPYCEIQYSESNIEAEAFWKKSGYARVSQTCRKMLSD